MANDAGPRRWRRIVKTKITVTGTAPIVSLNLDLVAEALAAELRQAIASQPDGKWQKTGTLAAGIRATADEVSVSTDRLTAGRIAEAFAEQVMPDEPLASQRVRVATEQAIAASVKETK